MSFDPDKPYNDLSPLPPKAQLETKAVLRKAIGANKALAELKGAGELIPNQVILINSIPLAKKRYVQKFGIVGHVFGICPGRGHIPARTNMTVNRDKGVFEELSKIFGECREPNWDSYGAQAVCARKRTI